MDVELNKLNKIVRIQLLIALAAVALLFAGCGSNRASNGNMEGASETTSDAENIVDSTEAEDAQSTMESGEQAASRNIADVREDGVFRIVATTTQVHDLAQILSQDVGNVEITGLMGAGVDPHLYQPTESDIRAMNAADMVLYSGLNLEGQMDAVFESLSEQGVLVYPISRSVKNEGFTIGGFTLSDEFVDVDDPHFWFDPRNWQLTSSSVAQILAEADPIHADTYTANAEDYDQQLTALYEWMSEGMTSVDEGQRYLVTSHDAFQYFGAAVGWQMTAIQGLSTQDEAGVGDIQGVVDFVLENNIPVVFVESSVSPSTIQAVIEAVQADGGNARIGVREMYSDAMGEPGTFGGTYIGMIAENVYTVLQSYACEGVDVTIPDWPQNLEPTPSQDLLNVDCE